MFLVDEVKNCMGPTFDKVPESYKTLPMSYEIERKFSELDEGSGSNKTGKMNRDRTTRGL